MHLDCIVSGASRAALLVPPAAGLWHWSLGKESRCWEKRLRGRLGWAERNGGRRQVGFLCPWEVGVGVGFSNLEL